MEHLTHDMHPKSCGDSPTPVRDLDAVKCHHQAAAVHPGAKMMRLPGDGSWPSQIAYPTRACHRRRLRAIIAAARTAGARQAVLNLLMVFGIRRQKHPDWSLRMASMARAPWEQLSD